MHSNIEIIRFRAWLEIGGTPDGPEDGSQGEVFPITSASIAATLNAIPVATVYVATGTRLQDDKPSPIHGVEGRMVRSPREWPWARIYFRNLQTLETAVIFEGFVEGSAQSFSFDSTEIALTIRHWLYALDAAPCISSVTNPSSSQVFTQFLYYKGLQAETGTGGAGDSYTGITLGDLLESSFTGSEEDMKKDVIQYGALKMLEFLHRQASEHAIDDFVRDANIQNDVLLSVDEILAKRIKTGDTANAALKADEFPILKIQTRTNSDELPAQMLKALSAIPVQSLQMNSIWAALLNMAGLFDFMLVPRVHELRFIPKWWLPAMEDIKLLKGTVGIHSDWQYARPIGAVVMLPETLSDLAMGAADVPGAVPIDGAEAMPLHGRYVPPDKAPGTLLVRQRTGWAGQVVDPSLFHSAGDMIQEEATQATSTERDGKSAAQKEADGRSFYDTLAEEAYWDEIMKGRRADLICPIRFDICPGSTVRVRTGGDIRLQARNQDQLATEYVGFVTGMRLTFDTINATAGAQFTLTHLRDAQEQKNLLKHHPIYQCGPFSNAVWTKKRFKTVEGSE